ncbi:hypothetical protein [Carnobacterium funditum]|uniref:hypothetical protein n=1 Tax=Carnobacterium funditum TaxID=2752 RepID=UPI00054F8374|nr:hypothetical protein [Carnobacterium funditum]
MILDKDNEIQLQGRFVDSVYEGDYTHSLLFREDKLGWISMTIVKETDEYKSLKFNQRCKVKALLTSKVNYVDEEIKCTNLLYLKSYEEVLYPVNK